MITEILSCAAIAFSMIAGGNLVVGANLISSEQAVPGFLFPYSLVFWAALVGLLSVPAVAMHTVLFNECSVFEMAMAFLAAVVVVVLAIGMIGVWSAQKAALKDIVLRNEAERLKQMVEDLRRKTEE